jgi:hypothetical protein
MSSGAKLRDCCERSQETLTGVSVRNAEAMNSFVVMPNLEAGKNLGPADGRGHAMFSPAG